MPGVLHRHHFVIASVASLMAAGCLRFGFETTELPMVEGAGASGRSSTGPGGSAGTSNPALGGTSVGAAAGVSIAPNGGTDRGGASSAGAGGISGTLIGTNSGGTAATTIASAGASTNGGVAGSNSLSDGGTSGRITSSVSLGGTAGTLIGTNGGSNGGGRASTASLVGGGTSGTVVTASGGAQYAGNAGNAGASVTGGPSCTTSLTCNGASCCSAIQAPAGTYDRGSLPPYSATVNHFYLDKFEVTVGRFRAFIAAYDGWRAAAHPSANEGVHDNPTIAGSGWDPIWNANLPASAAVFLDSSHLASCGTRGTWTNAPGGGTPNPENYPINCVSWYEAFAFCIWDGGRLPTEAEWEYIAGGGAEYRTFPWGDSPSSDPLPADYLNNHNTPFLEVGSEPAGNGRWGHSDLVGSMTEWIFDWWASDYPSTCDNCVNLSVSSYRCSRGGTWLNTAVSLEVGSRGYASPDSRLSFAGLRCARSAK